MFGDSIGGRVPPLLPAGSALHPLFGPRPPTVAPPHKGYQRPNHSWLTSSFAQKGGGGGGCWVIGRMAPWFLASPAGESGRAAPGRSS